MNTDKPTTTASARPENVRRQLSAKHVLLCNAGVPEKQTLTQNYKGLIPVSEKVQDDIRSDHTFDIENDTNTIASSPESDPQLDIDNDRIKENEARLDAEAQSDEVWAIKQEYFDKVYPKQKAKRTIPAEKPTDANYYADAMVEDLAATHAKLLTQSAQLAEALRDALKYADSATEHPENKAAFKRIVSNALAVYEAAR